MRTVRIRKEVARRALKRRLTAMEALSGLEALPGTRFVLVFAQLCGAWFASLLAPLLAPLLALAGGLLLYLASPRQQMRAAVRRRALCAVLGALCAVLGALCCGVAALSWHSQAGWPVALCATVATLAASLALMPFIGAWIGARAAKRATLPTEVGDNVRPSRRTGIQ
jgi:cation transport ATPase